jgi:hypothetical protein
MQYALPAQLIDYYPKVEFTLWSLDQCHELGYGIPDEEALIMCTIQATTIPSLNVVVVEKDEEFQKSFKEFSLEDKFALEELPSWAFHVKALQPVYVMMIIQEDLLRWSKEVFESLDTEKHVIQMRGLQRPKHACVSL